MTGGEYTFTIGLSSLNGLFFWTFGMPSVDAYALNTGALEITN